MLAARRRVIRMGRQGPIWLAAFVFAGAAALSAPALAQPVEVPARFKQRLERDVATMQSAIRNCDYDRWAKANQDIDLLRRTVLQGFRLELSPPPWPFPCVPVATAQPPRSPVVATPNPWVSYAVSVAFGLEVGFGGGDAGFTGTSFDVPVSGGFGGFYFNARTYLSPNIGVGGRIGAQFGDISGSRENPANHTDHTVSVGPMVYAEAELFVGYDLGAFRLEAEVADRERKKMQVSVSAGAVVGSRELTLTGSTVGSGSTVSTGTGLSSPSVSGGGPRSESQTSIGFTSSLQVAVPITPMIDLTGGVRYIHFSNDEFFGGIRMDNTIWSGTVGLKFNFYQEPTRRGGLDVM